MPISAAQLSISADTRILERDILNALKRIESSGKNVINVRANVNTGALNKSLQKTTEAVKRTGRGLRDLSIDDAKIVRPLGRITGSTDQFSSSMKAAQARTLAFVASASLLAGIQRIFKETANVAIEVEKALTDINIVLNTTGADLDKFGQQLFKIAKNTGQTFAVVAEGATELARQGLGTEETLRRLNDALILTRLSGLDSVASVEALTAAINTFKGVALTSSEVVSRFINEVAEQYPERTFLIVMDSLGMLETATGQEKFMKEIMSSARTTTNVSV